MRRPSEASSTTSPRSSNTSRMKPTSLLSTEITPGMIGQYLVSLGGSAAKRNLHLSALRGFFDRLVNRHVVILNPASSVRGVKDEVIEGKTPEITLEQARTLLASIKTVGVMT